MKIVFIAIFWTIANIFILSLSFIFLSQNSIKANAKNNILSIRQTDLDKNPEISGFIPSSDIRVTALKRFLKEYKSPLYEYAEVLVKQADVNGLDYRIIPAIAMQESGGCKKIPLGSNNCWGFGIFSSKVTKFQSYPQAIEQIAKTIKEKYVKDGLTNATLVEDKWAPPSKGQWSYSVNFFLGKIRKYENEIQSP